MKKQLLMAIKSIADTPPIKFMSSFPGKEKV